MRSRAKGSRREPIENSISATACQVVMLLRLMVKFRTELLLVENRASTLSHHRVPKTDSPRDRLSARKSASPFCCANDVGRWGRIRALHYMRSSSAGSEGRSGGLAKC